MCIFSLFIGPLYFYLPYVGGPACMSTGYRASGRISYDLFYLFHIVMKFRTAFVALSSRVFGRGKLVRIARRLKCLKSDFIVDLAAFLSLPQIVIHFVIPVAS